MALSVPIQNFSVAPNAGPTLPDLTGDFFKSALQGYQFGRLIAGIPQQQDAMELAIARQRFTQDEQMFPIQRDLAAARVAPAQLAATQAEALTPGAADSAKLTQQVEDEQNKFLLGALKKGEQVQPIATDDGTVLGWNILDPFTGKPRFVQNRTSGFKREMGAPFRGEDGRMYISVRNDDGTYSAEPIEGGEFFVTPQLKTEEGGATYFVNKITGEATPVIKQGEQGPEQLILGTPTTRKVGAEVRALDDLDVTLSSLENLYTGVMDRGLTGPVAGRAVNFANWISGGAAVPEADVYRRNKAGFLASLRGMTGDDARFSDADAKRIEQLLSEIEQAPSSAKLQWKEINEIVEKRRELRWADDPENKRASSKGGGIEERSTDVDGKPMIKIDGKWFYED